MGTLCCAPFVCFGTIFQDYVGSYETPPTPPNFLKEGRERGARKSFVAQIKKGFTRRREEFTVEVLFSDETALRKGYISIKDTIYTS